MQQFSNRTAIFLLVGLFPILTLVSPASGLNLDQALELAQQHDSGYHADLLESQARNADGWSRVAALGPRGTVTAKMMRSRLNYSPEETSGLDEKDLTFSDAEVNLMLEQPLVDMEKIYTARRGRCEMEIAELERIKAEENLVIRVVDRYFTFLSARDEASLAEAKLKFLARQLDTARTGHELGLGERSDLFDIRGRYETTRAALALLEAKLVDARAALSELLGVEIKDELEPNDVEEMFTAPGHNENYWLKQAVENNVDCRISRLQAEAARLDSMIVAGRFLPSLSMYLEHEQTSPDNDTVGYGWDRERTDIGLMVRMEFLSGGGDVAETIARRRRYRAAKQRVFAMRRSILRRTRASWNNLQRLKETIAFHAEAVAANEKSLQIREAGYQEGLQTMLDVLNVQKDYFEARNRYQKARYDYQIAWADFMQLAGQLDGMLKHRDSSREDQDAEQVR